MSKMRPSMPWFRLPPVGGGGSATLSDCSVDSSILQDSAVSSLGIQNGTILAEDFAAMTSSALAGVISDETGSDALVFQTEPDIYNPKFIGINGIFATDLINGVAEGRLTLTTATPVTTSDVTGAGTIYYTPYKGNRIALWTGSEWNLYSFSELSLSLTLTSGKNYDVFVYDNSGTLTLLLSAAWTNDTTREDALTTQNGVLVKNSDSGTRRYLGTIRASGSNTTEDSASKRFVWNHYNRVPRHLYAKETTDSWTYTTATFREANGGSTEGTSRVGYVQGISEDIIDARVGAMVSNPSSGVSVPVGIGVDSSTVNSAGIFYNATAGTTVESIAFYHGNPGIGYHTLRWLEFSDAVGTSTWYGDGGVAYLQSGLLAKLNM